MVQRSSAFAGVARTVAVGLFLAIVIAGCGDKKNDSTPLSELANDSVLNLNVPGGTRGPLAGSAGGSSQFSAPPTAIYQWTVGAVSAELFTSVLKQVRGAGTRITFLSCSGATFAAAGIKILANGTQADVSIGLRPGTPTLTVGITGNRDVPGSPAPKPTVAGQAPMSTTTLAPLTDESCPSTMRKAAGLA